MQLSSAPKLPYSQEAHFEQFFDTDDFQTLLEAQKFLKQELVKVKERLLTVATAQRSAKTASRGTSAGATKKAKTS
jgi:hypothetical protein